MAFVYIVTSGTGSSGRPATTWMIRQKRKPGDRLLGPDEAEAKAGRLATELRELSFSLGISLLTYLLLAGVSPHV
jgi:hypothetical protein